MGQFERTLIIVDEGAYVHYVEGCTAPIYASDSLHSAVVEIIVKKGARCRYTTIQNWSQQRLQPRHQARGGLSRRDDGVGRREPRLEADHEVPERLLMEPGAHAEILSIAFAGKGQHQDAGGKAVHAAPNTTSSRVEVDQQGRSARRLPRADQGREGRGRLQVAPCAATR
jgi:Fe-S cluster assembly protein SufB